MKRYLIKRLLIIIPTLFVISVIAFFLSKRVPQDPVNSVMSLRGIEHIEGVDPEELYARIYNELNLQLPDFYFSVVPDFYPQNINAVSREYDRIFYKNHLAARCPASGIEDFILEFKNQKARNTDIGLIHKITPQTYSKDLPPALKDQYESLLATRKKFFIPNIHWHGSKNQYHMWVKSFFDGSFGVSLVDGKSALSKVRNALAWTLSITLLDFIISLPLGILIGFYLSKNPSGKYEQWLSQILYFIYAIPVFWLATMLVVFFTTDDYGSMTNIFPSVGIDVYPGKSTSYHIIHNASKLILPVFILVIHALAYTSRFVRRSILNEMDKDYVLTAYSKGLNKAEVLKKHILPNALIPVITILVAMIPAAFTSSLIIEVIFNIPGIGRLMFNSIQMADWNVSFCILMIVATVTILSYLLGDILYAIVNPKLRFK